MSKVFLEFDTKRHVIMVDRLPAWFGSADVIEKRGNRTYVRSLTQTKPRWEQLWRRFICWIRKGE